MSVGKGGRESAVALIMVLLVLSALAIVAGPFAVSMVLHDRSSRVFEGEVKARLGAEGARNHARAHLERTLRAEESDREAQELEQKRPADPGRGSTYRSPPRGEYQKGGRSAGRRPPKPRRQGLVVRRDLGEEVGQRGRNRDLGKWARDTRKRQVTSIDEETDPIFLISQKGPPPKDWDPPGDLEAALPGPVAVEDPEEPGAAVALGSLASVRVEDEQGKVNLNTAPPNLLGNLFGSSRLAKPLEPGATSLSLEDASAFRTDWDERTLDGAVVIAHPENARLEAVTYRARKGNDLEGCFRGAFFSLPNEGEFPAGSLVWDLRGFKAGHHSLRAHASGGFAPDRLAEFATVEAMRDIASWQIASLFLIRFRGEGLTGEFLQKNGISARKLEELGLDPAIFAGEDVQDDPELKAEYQAAVKSLRRLRVQQGLIDSLKKARGARAVLAFEARVSSLKPAEAQKAAEAMKQAIERDKRSAPRFDRKYLEECLGNLAEVYRAPGVETVLPEELEALREFVTVSSWAPARWSEAQSIPDPLPAGPTWDESFRAARPGELGGGALVRIRSRKAPHLVEFNRLVHRGGKNIPIAGFQLAYPLERGYEAHEAWVQALVRHPVNVNTASERVLRAVFTGVQGFKLSKEGDHTVTPAEAARLASRVRSRVPLKGHDDLRELLYEAAEANAIDEEDIEPLLLNAIQPDDPRLRTSTTGLCYATGDVYTIEAVGVLRSEAGSEVAAARLRELVEVSSPEPLQLGLFSQADYQSELFLDNPYGQSGPDSHAFHAVGFPGIRSHLTVSTPLFLRNWFTVKQEGLAALKKPALRFPFAGGEVGTLRLAPAESRRNESTRGEIYHFRSTFEGLELGPGEPFVLEIEDSLDGSGSGPGTQGAVGRLLRGGGARGAGAGAGGATGGGVTAGSGPGGTGILDLTNMPAAVDFWCRFRTYPEAANREGMAVILDAGADAERNRISLLYDRSRSEFVARIYDSSLPDPSIPEGKQFIEVRAKRPLDLETWYHLRLVWDGAYAGGLQLFIDGLPAGTASFATELAVDMPARGTAAVPVKDASVLPTQGGRTAVVRVGPELVEVEGGTRIRLAKRSSFVKWREEAEKALAQKHAQWTADSPGWRPRLPQGPAAPGASSAALAAERLLMRGPWNQRASAGSQHLRGTPVSLHGYSLEMVRKIRDREDLEHQVSWNHQNCDRRVWAPCGLTLGDDLLTWNNFTPEVVAIHHYAPHPSLLGAGREGEGRGEGGRRGGRAGGSGAGGRAGGGASVGQYIAPVFLVDIRKNVGGVIPGVDPAQLQKYRGNGLTHVYSAEVQFGGQIYNAADFFQRQGVLLAWLHDRFDRAASIIMTTQADLHYEKGNLPGDHPAAKATDENNPGENIPLVLPQRRGLRIARWYPVSTDAPHLRPKGANVGQPRPDLLYTYIVGAWLRAISVLASGDAAERYPASGVLEVRGRPAPWSSPMRPDLSAAPLFDNHPEDTVEWIRYVRVYNRNMFIGRWRVQTPQFHIGRFFDDPFNGDGCNNHRGYPEGWDELKNQMFHKLGEPLRLVMELADGGAGYGDYVSIATNDPAVGESVVRRIYSVTERNDGRFFASLVDVDASGNEVRGAAPYRHTYTPEMNPRLVKFPSGALPQVGTGRLVIFGESGGVGLKTGGSAAGRSSSRSLEEEETAGAILDEVRRSRDRTRRVHPGRGQREKHVLVPLENGRVRFQQLGDGLAAISGLIDPGKSITRESPLEVLVVSTGREPDLFARGVERGLLRIGEELFFFEDPDAGDGSRSVAQGASGGQQAQGTGTVKGDWDRDPTDDDETGATGGGGEGRGGDGRGGGRGGDGRGGRDGGGRGAPGSPGGPRGQQAPQGPAGPAGGAYDPDTSGERPYDERSFVFPSPPLSGVEGRFEREGFARIDDASPQLHGFYEVFYYRQFGGGRFQDCLRGQFQTAIVAKHAGTHALRNVTTRIRLIGRSLLGTRRAAHGFGDPVSLVPYLDYTEVTGPMTALTLSLKDTKGFGPYGYLLLDSGTPGAPFEIVAYGRPRGEGALERLLDEEGKGILRGAFGTPERPVHAGMFAYALPFRHFDRYQAEAESESLAYLQKSFRVGGAFWRGLRWRERAPRGGKERLCDLVVTARIDGAPDWSEKPTNKQGGLFLFEDRSPGSGSAPEFPIEAPGDELELRIYFRYKQGAFQRVTDDHYRDDWKETPVLEWIAVEYEKAGRIVRHEEPPY